MKMYNEIQIATRATGKIYDRVLKHTNIKIKHLKYVGVNRLRWQSSPVTVSEVSIYCVVYNNKHLSFSTNTHRVLLVGGDHCHLHLPTQQSTP
jgi:hypothetical protein